MPPNVKHPLLFKKKDCNYLKSEKHTEETKLQNADRKKCSRPNLYVFKALEKRHDINKHLTRIH